VSGSRFDPVQINDKLYECEQADTLYVFPGLALGACLARATSITDSMLLRASHTLAAMAYEGDSEKSQLYPNQNKIRAVTPTIAMAVLDQALEAGVARIPRPDYPLREYIRNNMYYPQYP
jgi:malic enzyme